MNEDANKMNHGKSVSAAEREHHLIRTRTWQQEASLHSPIYQVSLEEKRTFSLENYIYVPRPAGLHIRSAQRPPLFIIPQHHYLIDVLQYLNMTNEVGSIQFDLHRDLMATNTELTSDGFEAAFNDELLHRGIFHRQKLVIGLPCIGDEPSQDDRHLTEAVRIVRLNEQYDAQSLVDMVGRPFVFHLDLDIFCGKTERKNRYTLGLCTPEIITHASEANVLVTSLGYTSFENSDLDDINTFVQTW